MTMQPITDETGEVVDEFDDGHSESPAEEGPPAPASSAEDEEGQVVLPEQGAPTAPAPAQPTSAARVTKEDPTDFDESDVKIEILLHRADGNPQGRLVSVLIHNFSGPPMAQDFREAELSDKARLDSIQRAIYPVMQRFLLELSARRQKKLEDEAKRAPRAAPAASSQAATTTPAKLAPATAPAQPPAPASSAAAPSTATGAKASEKKKEGGKYQSIPLF